MSGLLLASIDTEHTALLVMHVHTLATSPSGGGGWDHLQDSVHMAAARLGCKRAMIGTKWANSHPGYTDRPRKQVNFWQGRLLGVQWGWLRMSLLMRRESALRFNFEVQAQTEMKIWCVKVCIC